MSTIAALTLLAQASIGLMSAPPAALGVGATVIRPVAIAETAPLERPGGAVIVICNSPAVDVQLTGGSAVATDAGTIEIRPAGTQPVDLTLIY